MKRFLVIVGAVGLSLGLLAQPASAACEGPSGDGPRGDGNEVIDVYVEAIPVDGEVAGQEVRLDEAWIEVHDDAEELPVAVEVGWKGGTTPSAGPVPGLSGALALLRRHHRELHPASAAVAGPSTKEKRGPDMPGPRFRRASLPTG